VDVIYSNKNELLATDSNVAENARGKENKLKLSQNELETKLSLPEKPYRLISSYPCCGILTARDLMIFIASQCYSLHKRNVSHINYDVRDLSNVLGKNKDISIKRFNQDLKRALELLTKNYQEKCQDDFFPAKIIRLHRSSVYLRIFTPQNHRNILCA
jgi:hypothetical protein